MLEKKSKYPEDKKNLKPNQGVTLSHLSVTLIVLIMLILLFLIFWLLRTSPNLTFPWISNNTIKPVTTSTAIAETDEEPDLSEEHPTPTDKSGSLSVTQESPPEFKYTDLIVIAMTEVGYSHLFAYHPQDLSFTRLTFGEWDDIQPALSPDGTRVAFASQRSGYWDIYVLDLTDGKIKAITENRFYEGSPAWSPDGEWIAYEKYFENNLDIYIQPVDGSLEPIRVTYDTAVDTQPVWHPDGKLVAFATSRGGNFDIYTANIDSIGQDEALVAITILPHDQTFPAWSPDGEQISWISDFEGYDSIFTATLAEGESSAVYLGSGSLARWDSSGDFLLAEIRSPDQSFIGVYSIDNRQYAFPPQALSGQLDGFTWGMDGLGNRIPSSIHENASITPSAPWFDSLTPGPGSVYGRQYTIELPDIKAPTPALSALVVEPFFSLRDRANTELGWDVLSDLENAYIPLTEPLSPGLSNDWLYTGRAFALNRVLLNMDYMQVVREDFNGRTYWRLYLRPLNQDGSQGRPITQLPWDFNARFSGNTTFYEEGGASEDFVPIGYWIDFTQLALEYGWERLPALSNWRSYMGGTRFNVFAITSGLDWEAAMLQLYPPEIFMQPLSPTGQ